MAEEEKIELCTKVCMHVIVCDLHSFNSHLEQVFERIDPWQILQCCRLGVVCTRDRNRNMLSSYHIMEQHENPDYKRYVQYVMSMTYSLEKPQIILSILYLKQELWDHKHGYLFRREMVTYCNSRGYRGDINHHPANEIKRFHIKSFTGKKNRLIIASVI